MYRDDPVEMESNAERNRLNMCRSGLTSEVVDYINTHIEKVAKTSFEIFENEDIKPDIIRIVSELQNNADDFLKKTGGVVSGQLQILNSPEASLDAVNKEYVDYQLVEASVETANKLKVLDETITHLNNQLVDIVRGIQVFEKKTTDVVQGCFQEQNQHIISKGQIVLKKTYFFNPGFICPQKIHITSVGFSTSPYKFKIGEKTKINESIKLKLYFMVNNEIKSEYQIAKDIQLGYCLQEFETPIIFEKNDSLMMIIESVVEDVSVNITFH